MVRIQGEGAGWIEEEKEIIKVFERYYRKLFTSSGTGVEEVLSCVKSVASET